MFQLISEPNHLNQYFLKLQCVYRDFVDSSVQFPYLFLSSSKFPGGTDSVGHFEKWMSTIKKESHLGERFSFCNYIKTHPQAGIKIARRNINNLRYADDTTLTAEREEELRSLLMKVKEQSEKAGLKLNIQKTKIMVSGPITSWHVEGEKVETITDFIFLGSKITVDGDYSLEI